MWKEVGCAPRDVSVGEVVGVSGWKEVLSGEAKELERWTDGRARYGGSCHVTESIT